MIWPKKASESRKTNAKGANAPIQPKPANPLSQIQKPPQIQTRRTDSQDTVQGGKR